MRQPRPPPPAFAVARINRSRQVHGKPKLMLSADGTIAKITHSITKSAIIRGSQFSSI